MSYAGMPWQGPKRPRAGERLEAVGLHAVRYWIVWEHVAYRMFRKHVGREAVSLGVRSNVVDAMRACEVDNRERF